MPNRIIKESIRTSETLNGLSTGAEVFFYRLITQVDDYGRLDGRPQILRARCFPLKLDAVSNDEISSWLGELERAELIARYTVDDHLYLQLSTWEKHQRIRAKISKYPSPAEVAPSNDSKSLTDDSKSQRNAPVIQNPESINVIQNPETVVGKKTYPPLSQEMKLAKKLKTLMLGNDPAAKIPKDLQTWAAEMGKIIRIDKRSPEEVERAIEYSQANDFWKPNILSATKLREKLPTLLLQADRDGKKEAVHGYRPEQGRSAFRDIEDD